METEKIILLTLLFLSPCLQAQNTTLSSSFLSCLSSSRVQNLTTFSSTRTSSYYNLLDSSIRNLRFAGRTVPKPIAIIVPTTKYQLRSSILCCRNSSLVIRLRSGGHSYEGLSYTGPRSRPFVVIDLMSLNRVRVNLKDSTAWVESGATLGEIYHSVATESGGSLGFPAGSCSTVGSGGQIGGGGFGFLSRKFGLAADNVLDVVLIDPAGGVSDRSSMDEDVFWAIRGGGGGSWGAIYAWKIRLVPVPARLTVFSISRTGPTRRVAQLVHKWQYIAPKLPGEFYLSTFISANKNGNVSASFSGQFLGPISLAISLLTERFPELRLIESDCQEMSWVESAVYFAGLSSVDELKVRESQTKSYFKAKSDYVRRPIPISGLVGAFDMLAEQPSAYIILDPYGGAMERIKSNELPFPHRKGNLYCIQYMVDWEEEEDAMRDMYIGFLRRFYDYMAPFVSMNPRGAYVNYLDLDLGVNEGIEGSEGAVSVGRVWGEKYFLGNYDRLVRAKTMIDPFDVFSNEQSIPPLTRK